MSLIATLICGQVKQACEVARGAVERGIYRSAEVEIHVPEKGQGAPVAGSEINHEVVRIVEGVGVHHSEERLKGDGPQPSVHIHETLRLLLQGGTAEGQRFGQGHEGFVTAGGAVVFWEEEPSIDLGIIAQVGDVHTRYFVRLGAFDRFSAAGDRGGGVINELQFEFVAVRSVFKLGVQKHVAVFSQN